MITARTFLTTIVATGVALGLVACGGGSSRPHIAAAPTAATTASGANQPLARFILAVHEEPGFAIGPPIFPRTVTIYASTLPRPAADAARLRNEGFIAAVYEQLFSANGAGESGVQEFSSHRAALSEQAAELGNGAAKNPRFAIRPFAVAGVPGARASTVSGTSVQAANVSWVEGSCHLTLAEEGSSAASLARAETTAVEAIDRGTGGNCR
jgi:hypothetical protein